ncbi:winged helix-turn-helix protein, partial [Gluconacetobacter diazotrophicus]
MKALVEAGPDRQRDGVVRWRRVDLQRVIEERFGVVYHERHVTARIAEVQVETRRHQATVALIRALGVWSRDLVVHYFHMSGRMRYGPGSPRKRHDDS